MERFEDSTRKIETKPKENESFDLANRIESNKKPDVNKKKIEFRDSLDDLSDLNHFTDLEQLKTVLSFKRIDLVTSIEEAEAFLTDNIFNLLVGVLTQGHDNLRNNLGQKLRAIPEVDYPGLQLKVKELLKAKLDKFYKANRVNLLTQAINETSDFETLNTIHGQYKPVDESGLKIDSKEDHNLLNQAKADLAILMTDRNWLKLPDDELETELYHLTTKIPQEFGLRSKVIFLMRKELADKRVKEKTDKLTNSWWCKAKNWFKQAT